MSRHYHPIMPCRVCGTPARLHKSGLCYYCRKAPRPRRAKAPKPDALSGNLSAGYRLGLWLRLHHNLPPLLPNELEWRKRNSQVKR